MKILVTGVAGQLGYDVMRELAERGYTDVLGIDRDELDITDEVAVHKFIEEYNPDVIMHNAAWTAVDKAEELVDACRNVNVNGTKYIAETAEKIGAKLVYISTDYVFDGKGEKYFEVDDKKEPLSVYGKTKYEGELETQKCSKCFIVRISWVFGVNGNNFIKTMLRLAETKTSLNIVCDQIGSPTYTYDLSKLLCDMIETEKYGIYHATNEGICSWSDFAKKIFEIAGVETMTVNPVTTADYQKLVPQQAVRPLNSRMSKKSLDDAGFSRLPSWEDATERFIKNELKR
ncbi:MAG: dTDP-4-dehydrorhamnose reductase [Clostridia bacterium]|nr:dTDP-4-dehydrorhamnose reductase [Clostridia bacterium]